MVKRIHLTATFFVVELMIGGAAIAADDGVYIGGAWGQGRPSFDTAGTVLGAGIGIDNSAYAYKVFGGYQLNKYFGAELTYVRLGDYKLTNGSDIVLSGWGLSAVGTLPVGNNFSLLGKLGGYRMRETLNPINVSDSTSTPNFGLGIKYDFNANVSVRAEAERFLRMGSNNNTISSDANMYSIGVGYKF